MSAIETILVATDLSPASEGAVAYAAGLAAATGARLELAHVVNGHVMMPRELVRPASERERAGADKRASDGLHELAAHLRVRHVPIECVIVHGNPREEIPRLAERVHAQLIVMAQARCFLGSIVETVMREVNIPMLVAPRAGKEAKCESQMS